jgi:polar amino acid transport system substrate-binding protein
MASWVGRAALCLIAFVACAAWARAAHADDLDEAQRDHKLLWGGDQEGGGPYVFPSDKDPTRVEGFEVDLARRLAEYLKVEAEFVQGQWDRMTDMVKADKIHIVLNGYEWSATRAEALEATLPYYVYGLQLLARKDDATIGSWDDLRKPDAAGAKRKVGVLIGSSAHEYVQKILGRDVEIVTYEGNTDSMRETETRKVDAAVQDTPIVSFYASRFPDLRAVGAPVEKGYYVALARKGEARLVGALNEALILMIRNGDLERIYKKFGIWDEAQAELAAIAETGRFYGYSRAVGARVEPGSLPPEEEVKSGTRKRGLTVVREYAGVMIQAAGLTVVLAVISFPLAILVGLFVAVGRLYGPRWLQRLLAAYVEFLRGTPLMLQLYFIFFFLPEVGIKVPAFATGILGLAVNYSAYEAEIYRAGLQAIPPGQMEAALSLGMSRGAAIRRIIVPQAVRIVIPPVVNDFIALFKDTSVCSVVTLVELTKRYSVLSMSTQATVELMLMTALLYLLMSYPMSLVSRALERRLGSQHAVA